MVRKRTGLVPKAARNCRASVQRSRPATRSSSCQRVRLGRLPGDQLANARQCSDVEGTAGPLPARSGREHVGDRDGDLGPAHFVDLLIDVQQRRDQFSRQMRCIDHRLGNERQRLAAERLLHERRVDIGDPVAETLVGAGAAVMRLVGMKDVTLAGQALPALATIAEALDARQRDADRIGVVPVRRKRLANGNAPRAARCRPLPSRT